MIQKYGSDLTGDGVSDVAVSAPYFEGKAGEFGAVYLLPGGEWSGEARVTEAAAAFYGQGDDWIGPLARVGDVTGNGIEELAIGSRSSDLSGTDAGALYLFSPGP